MEILRKNIKEYEMKNNLSIKKVAALFITCIKIIVVFATLWIFFSGNKDPLMVSCGIIAVIFTFIFCLRTKIFSVNTFILKSNFLKYIISLLKEIITSSKQTIKIIFSRKIIINPGTIVINVSNLTDQEKVLFSNLITMTPGTFVIAIDGDDFLIHALNKNDLDFKNNKKMSNLLDKIKDKDSKLKIKSI